MAEHVANAMAGNSGTTNQPEVGITLEQAKADTMLDKIENTELIIGNDTVWIPAGFKIHEDSADVVDEGIVITDGINEFVWVPVNENAFANMFNTGPVALSGNKGVTSNYYSNVRSTNLTIATVSEGQYSSTSALREPDLVTSSDSDAVTAGYTDIKTMAQGFVDDYTNMRASIEKYGGFYIGRYELTGTEDNPTVKEGVVMTVYGSNGWYKLYKASKNVVTGNNKATSTMIWGCQWDETINWLNNTNASIKGNCGTGEGQHTGYSEEWSANKIYDMAGNFFEYTQEAYAGKYVDRGRRL